MNKRLLVFGLILILGLAFDSPGILAKQLIVDTFRINDKGRFPEGWESKHLNEAKTIYRVAVENGNAVLCAHCEGKAIAIGKKIEFDLEKFPILTWRWKVVKSPKGADERHKQTGDSAAALYVVFPNGIKIWNPKAIKYVWSSSSMPQNTCTVSPYARNTKIVILENNKTPKGVWIREKVNVLKDYVKFFGKGNPKVKMIGIMSDSDNTDTEVHAFYDDIVVKGAE